MLTKEFENAKATLIAHVSSCRTLAEEYGDKAQCRILDSLVEELRNLTFNIAVVGGMKRGKSGAPSNFLGHTKQRG